MANFKYSSAGLELTKQFEGLELKAYQDSVGVWTIGHGHTGTDVVPGLVITQEHALVLLAADVSWAVTCVNKSVKSAIHQNHFDALVDFVFNLGCANFGQSTLLKMVNAGDFTRAAKEFSRWNKAKGKVLAGLTRRRTAEAELFQQPMVMAAPPVVKRLRAGAAPRRSAAPASGKKAAAKKAAPKKKASKKKTVR